MKMVISYFGGGWADDEVNFWESAEPDRIRLRPGLSEATEETQHVFFCLLVFTDRLHSCDAWSQKDFKSQKVN